MACLQSHPNVHFWRMSNLQVPAGEFLLGVDSPPLASVREAHTRVFCRQVRPAGLKRQILTRGACSLQTLTVQRVARGPSSEVDMVFRSNNRFPFLGTG